MAYRSRPELLAEVERLQGEILLLRAGIAGMDQNEAHRLRMEVIEATARVRLAEQRERFARAEADRCRLALRGLRDALLGMIDVDVLGDNYRPEQARRENP